MAFETNPIQKFYSVAQQRDFARLFQFRLRQFGNIAFSEDQLVYVESASIPGRSITNIPVTYMGMDFNTPGTVKYPGSTGYNVTFRCDKDYDIRSALEASSFLLFDESSSQGSYGLPDESNILIMELFNNKMETVKSYTLFGVWLQAIADTAYDVKDGGTIQTVQCTMAYQFWRTSNTSNPVTIPVRGGVDDLGPGNDLETRIFVGEDVIPAAGPRR